MTPDGQTSRRARARSRPSPRATRKTLEFRFKSSKTGQVVATYLKLDPTEGGAATGKLNFTLGVGERGVPLSPDTLVLPTAVDASAAAPGRSGHARARARPGAWPTPPPAPCPRASIKTSKAAVTQKALAFAEAGLRVHLGQDVRPPSATSSSTSTAAIPSIPGSTSSCARPRPAATSRAPSATSCASRWPARGPFAYERELAHAGRVGPRLRVLRRPGRHAGRTSSSPTRWAAAWPAVEARSASRTAAIPGGVIIPAGEPASAPLLGLVTQPTTSPFTLSVSGAGGSRRHLPGAATGHCAAHT